jgi:heme exporter protein A
MLSIKNLSCQKGYNLLFDALSFDVNAGDILRIDGRNGSGKTSLLKILAGLSSAETGKIFLNQHCVKSEKYQQEILYLGHAPSLSADLNTLENLEFLTQLNQSNLFSLKVALDKVGLKSYQNELCSKLSAGQKRRVILASLFTSDAKIWLLDEPFTALDPKGVLIVEAQIQAHCKSGGMCLFTTHQDTRLPNQKILCL